jgi:hypothetical protein
MAEAARLIPLAGGLSLAFGDAPGQAKSYATSHLQRGFRLLDGGEDLAEEAVGFGVPVVRMGLQTLFPGSVVVEWPSEGSPTTIRARYRLDRVEKFARVDSQPVDGRLFYTTKNVLAEVIRRWPISRNALTAASSALRRIFHWETTYVDAGFATEVEVTYSVDAGARGVSVQIEAQHLPSVITEVVMMNEQGAHFFDRYGDSSGLALQGRRIGCWDEVRGEAAWFESSRRKVAFRLGQVEGARLFRGRELVGSRLAWAGFGYSFAPSVKRLRYDLTITRSA